jgi:hypothetical protein
MVPKSLFSRLRSDSSPVDGAEKAEEGGGGRPSSSSSNTCVINDPGAPALVASSDDFDE